MARSDIISQWAGTVQFAVISTPRRLVLTNDPVPSAQRHSSQDPWDYIEVDNRGNMGATIYWALNGRTASSVLQSTFTTADGAVSTLGAAAQKPNFRLRTDTIERIFAKATSISVVSVGNATTVYINVGRF